ncbi:MAG: pyridoxal phosphate-dependent aminotransferase [Flavobacteriaceae bacterium]|jgi:aspartate aminotransferase|nr:pyridoxal phosphate-dependent aminotransferase [Flavobacteriaceae bacterium]
MPSISNKGNLMPESPIRKLVPYAEKAKQRGIKVFHLNIGQPDIETPKNAINAVKNADIKILAYSKSEGDLVLREKISEYYRTFNVLVSSSEIIVTSGASEALLFSIGSIMDPNDEIIIPEPFYANYNGFSVANGVKIVPIFSSIDDNFSLPNIEEFENLITDKTKAILICNPNNPTGYVYSKEELKILIKIVKKHNLFLIVDEVYREFTYDGTSHTSVMEFDEISENAIVIDSVSKRYSMCGARIGCIISKNKEFLNTAMKFAQARLSPPSLAQIASTAALDTGKDYFEKIIEEYNKRRVVLIKGLKDIPGVKVSEPKGAFYCVAELPVDDSENFAKWLLESYNLNKKTIMIAPAGGFYSTPNAGNNQVRIAYVLNENDLKDSIEILKIGLIEYSK